MSSNNRIRRSIARVEFLACREIIESMLAQGYSRQLIYEELKSKKNITMAYVTFAKLIVKAAGEGLQPTTVLPAEKTPPPPPSAPKPAQNSGPRIVKTEQTPFPDPRKMRVEDAI